MSAYIWFFFLNCFQWCLKVDKPKFNVLLLFNFLVIKLFMTSPVRRGPTRKSIISHFFGSFTVSVFKTMGDGLFRRWKIHRIGWSNVPGRKDPSSEDGNSQLLSHPRSLSPFSEPSSSSPSPLALGDLCCYISPSSVHPPPTLVSHPCPYSSAHPIGHSF